MKAKINRQLFTTTTFDSGSLGLLVSVIHRFDSPGLYRVEIRRGGRAVGAVSFAASADSKVPQLNLDLASLHQQQMRVAECECAPEPQSSTMEVSTEGYVIFYVSRGDGGFSAVVSRDGGKEAVFDTAALSAEDLVALSLLEPARYSMTNALGKAKGTVTVSFGEQTARSRPPEESCLVEVHADRFEPSEIEVVPTQGIVFRVHEQARVVVKRGKSGMAAAERPRRRRFTKRGGS